MHVEPVRGAPGVPGLGAMLAAAVIAATLLAAGWTGAGLPGPACPLRSWTGWPCPGCGSTHMLVALAHGDLVAALAWNPFALLGVLVVTGWGIVSAIGLVVELPRFRVVLGAGERIAVRAGAIAAAAAAWAYLVWRET